jgi:hypothetical protein
LKARFGIRDILKRNLESAVILQQIAMVEGNSLKKTPEKLVDFSPTPRQHDLDTQASA